MVSCMGLLPSTLGALGVLQSSRTTRRYTQHDPRYLLNAVYKHIMQDVVLAALI